MGTRIAFRRSCYLTYRPGSVPWSGSSSPQVIFHVYGEQIEWEVGRKLACMGWTEAEELITILQDGTVNYYTIHGKTGDIIVPRRMAALSPGIFASPCFTTKEKRLPTAGP